MLRVFWLVTSEYQMQPTDCMYILPPVRHALNNPQPLQRKHIITVTALIVLEPPLPISTFYRIVTSSVIEIEELKWEHIFNINELQKLF